MLLLFWWLTTILRQLLKNDVNNADSLSLMMSLFLKTIKCGHFILSQYYIHTYERTKAQNTQAQMPGPGLTPVWLIQIYAFRGDGNRNRQSKRYKPVL